MNRYTVKQVKDIVTGSLNSKLYEIIIYLLMQCMRFAFVISKKYRRNIENFKGIYQFRTQDKKVIVSVIFENTKNTEKQYMKIGKREIFNSDVEVVFRDTNVIRYFLSSDNPDILNCILNQEIVVNGNLNYIYRFGYLTNRLQKIIKSHLGV